MTTAELSEHIEDAFLSKSASTSDLLNAALSSHARQEIFAALNRLPDRQYASLPEVLACLGDLVVEANT